MVQYEIALILRAVPLSDFHQVLRGVCTVILQQNALLRGMENLGKSPDCSFLSCCHPKQSLNHRIGFPGRYVTLLVMMSRHRYLSNQIAVFSI